MNALILAIVGETVSREAIARHLSQNGLRVVTATSLNEGVALARRARPALVLCRTCGDLSGLRACRLLRREGHPLILLLAEPDTETDAVAALDAGADHFLTLPCSLEELTARVRSLLRRTGAGGHGSGQIQVGDVSISLPLRRVTRGGQLVRLAPKEFEILAALAERAGRVVGRGELLRLVWGDEQPVKPQTLDVHVFALRSKIEKEPSRPALLVTVRGVGYRLIEQEGPQGAAGEP